MDNKELEDKLKESANNVEVRDFSLVWSDIKHRVKGERSKLSRCLLSAISASASALIACSIIIPVVIHYNKDRDAGTTVPEGVVDEEQTYFEDDLIFSVVSFEEFCNQIAMVDINIIDVSDYAVCASMLLKTPMYITKGGLLELTDDVDNSSFYLVVKFYDEKIQRNDQIEIVYDMNYTVNDAEIEYRVKEAYPDDGIYIYDIRANFNKVNYFIEYTCFTEDIKPFLDEFFNN